MAARHAAPNPPRISRREKTRGAAALLLLLLLLAGIPALLLAVTGVPFVHGLPSWSHLSGRLRSPDDGQLLLDVLLILAWAGWTAFTVSAIAETIALARHTVAPALFGLNALQPGVGRLLASVALLLPASGAVLHLGGGALPTRPPVTAPLRPAAASATPPRVARPASVSPRTPVRAVQATVMLPVYVVGTDQTGQRDTLWSIAARHLGNPLRWHDIASLNEGQQQADGGVFTDPNLIRPGWQLLLPADATGLTRPIEAPPTVRPVPNREAAPAAPPTASPQPQNAQPALPPVPAPVIAPPDPAPTRQAGALPTPTVPASAVPTPAVTRTPSSTASPVHQRSDAQTEPRHDRSAPVSLGTGSEISAALAAAVVLALNLRRRRRRRRYQPQPPKPARFNSGEPLPPALHQLILQTPASDAVSEPPEEFFAAVTADRSWKLGVHDNDDVVVSWVEHPVLHLTGEGAADVARAILASALLEQPGNTDILTVGTSFHDLLPGISTPIQVRQLPNLSAATECVQLEAIARSRRLADAEISSGAAYRNAHPENPFPALLIISDQPLDAHPALTRLLTNNTHLDIAACIVTDPDLLTPTDTAVEVHRNGDAGRSQPAALAQHLAGTRLHRLTSDDAVPLLAAALAPVNEKDESVEATATAMTATAAGTTVPDVDWTATAAAVPPAGQQAPFRVQLVGPGPIRIWLHDAEITAGLRESARQLLAWFLVHPEGRTIDSAVTAIWPDVSPERGSKRFWTALGNLRSRLTDPGGTRRPVLVKTAGAYQPQPDTFDVDLWAFQAALQRAAETADAAPKLLALRLAIDTYQGCFALDADYVWAEPIREELHHRALDAHVAYAELAASRGRADQAIATLERARQLDPDAEDIYRRLMRLHHEGGRTESALQLWRQLTIRLGELDVDPDPETSRLYRRIRGLDTGRRFDAGD